MEKNSMKPGAEYHLASARVFAVANMAAMPLRMFLLLSMTPKCQAAIATYR
jgi:hypothetical protein